MKPAAAIAGLLLPLFLDGCQPGGEPPARFRPMPAADSIRSERQITRARYGHILTNTGVWSPDGEWIVYDIRPDAAGDVFDGTRIEMVHVRTGEVRVLYESRNGARCGVASFHPREMKVAFILGPEHPTPDWSYHATRRQGVVVDAMKPGTIRNLDARDLTPPFTPGALRGGSHVHVWDASGEWVSFTYEDHVLAQFQAPRKGRELNLRNVGVSVPGHAVRASRGHPRNHDGDCFSILATRSVAEPRPGSDEIKKAFEEAWVGTNGYVNNAGQRQRRALAFQGHVVTERGDTIAEVFIADLPNDVTRPGDGPLAGTATQMPRPPRGTAQRRLTFTAARKYPGIQGPRHWLRSSPDGSRIAFLMRDDAGIVQLWTVPPNGGAHTQLTRNPWSIASAFTWSPDGRRIACVMDHSVFVIDARSGVSTRLTPQSADETTPRPEACVFSPDGRSIAYVRRVQDEGQTFNQIFTVMVESGSLW
jgi:hypothetical protein